MANFVTVTRKDIMTPEVVNLDAVETIEISPPAPLPPLDSDTPITGDHLGSATLHFASGRAPLAILENAEDLHALKIEADPKKSETLKEAHAKKIAELAAKRAKERLDAEKAALAAKHEASEKELKAKEAAAAPVHAAAPAARS